MQSFLTYLICVIFSTRKDKVNNFILNQILVYCFISNLIKNYYSINIIERVEKNRYCNVGNDDDDDLFLSSHTHKSYIRHCTSFGFMFRYTIYIIYSYLYNSIVQLTTVMLQFVYYCVWSAAPTAISTWRWPPRRPYTT